MNWRRIVWLLALVTLPTLAEETPLQLVLRGAQHDQLYQLSSSGVTKVSALPDSLTTPLGSLWKLYVYAWLEDTHQPEQPYQCRGNSPEEVYCCQAGESITRDTALVRSCGLYFAPQRLHIGADVWGQYWQATAQAGQGERYDQILAFAYPDNSLSRWGAPRSTCQLLPKAKAWLAKKMPQWRRILQAETGYNEPDVFAVCRLVSGFPYTDRQQKRLFIRNFFTLQDRLDLTHEYLHLAFDGYPTGLDENYIETLTRQLLMD
ncbi:TPA: YfaQ family protein [Escherichia coli]|nr:YfaQ family protein [Escherichia coli]HBE4494081.1 YfaQ family protein [Escherichia coli]